MAEKTQTDVEVYDGPEGTDVDLGTCDKMMFSNLDELKASFPPSKMPLDTCDSMYIIRRTEKSWPLEFTNNYAESNSTVVIAGSAAILKLAEILGVQLSWKAADRDIFFIGAVGRGRIVIDDIDIVASEFDSVMDLLDSFDLPCSRVAYTNRYIFFTQQALEAILYGKYWIASIVKNKKDYCDSLTEIKSDTQRLTFFNKTQSRIEKYGRRDMVAQFFKSTTKPNFLAVRKAYSRYIAEPLSDWGVPTLTFNAYLHPLSRRDLYSFVKTDINLMARMEFDVELKEHLRHVLHPSFPLFQETLRLHGESLGTLKRILNTHPMKAPIHDAFSAEIIKLEHLYMAQKL